MKNSLRLLTALSIFFALTISGCTKENSEEPTRNPDGSAPDSLLKNMPTRFKITEYDGDGSSEGGYFSYKFDSINNKIDVLFEGAPFETYSYNNEGYLVSMWQGRFKLNRNGNKLVMVEMPQEGPFGEKRIDTSIVETKEVGNQVSLIRRTDYITNPYPKYTEITFFRKDNLNICDSLSSFSENGVINQPPYITKFNYDVQNNLIARNNNSNVDFTVEYENKTNPLRKLNELILGQDHNFLQPTAFEWGDIADIIESQVMLTPFSPARPYYETRLSLFHSLNLIKSVTFYYTDELTQTKKQDTFYFTNTFDGSGRLTSIAIKLGTQKYYEMQLEY